MRATRGGPAPVLPPLRSVPMQLSGRAGRRRRCPRWTCWWHSQSLARPPTGRPAARSCCRCAGRRAAAPKRSPPWTCRRCGTPARARARAARWCPTICAWARAPPRPCMSVLCAACVLRCAQAGAGGSAVAGRCRLVQGAAWDVCPPLGVPNRDAAVTGWVKVQGRAIPYPPEPGCCGRRRVEHRQHALLLTGPNMGGGCPHVASCEGVAGDSVRMLGSQQPVMCNG